MQSPLNLGFPLNLIGQVLPLAASTASKDPATRLDSKRRGLDHLEELGLGIALLFFRDPNTDPVARGRLVHKNRPARGIPTYAGSPTGQVCNAQF